jgi:hypothetical protein
MASEGSDMTNSLYGLESEPIVIVQSTKAINNPVSYTPPQILMESTSSPYVVLRVHLLSFSSVLHSTPLLMESSWSP